MVKVVLGTPEEWPVAQKPAVFARCNIALYSLYTFAQVQAFACTGWLVLLDKFAAGPKHEIYRLLQNLHKNPKFSLPGADLASWLLG
jgi:hypothetical protein